ncbi:LuxR C-terminal-related transcriptional regulator [Streptomyces albidoflavus]
MNAYQPGVVGWRNERHMPVHLSPEAIAIYQRVQGSHDAYVAPDEPGLQELLDHDLLKRNPWELDGNHYLAPDADQLWQGALKDGIAAIGNQFSELQRLHALLETLPRRGAHGETAGVEFLATKGAANAAIISATATSRHSILTAHPLNRAAETMAGAIEDSRRYLARGIELRTIYLDAARTRAPESTWAAEVTQLGAQVRTLPGDFLRMVIIDDFVVIPDHRPGPGYLDRTTAWLITNPGMVAFMRAVYDMMWRRAQPWRPDAETGPSATTITTATQRQILRLMGHGWSQEQIAADIGISARQVRTHLAELSRRLGLRGGQFALGMWWQASEERDLP